MIERYLDREELRRLLAALAVVLAGLSVAALFAILVVPGMRSAARPAAEAAVRPVTGESGWLDLTEFPPARGRDIPPVDPDSLLEPTPALRARGEELYALHCVTCHGPRGEGDGPAAGTMNPRPRNLAGPGGWVNGRHLPGLFRTLGEGIPKTSMTPYDFLSRQDRMALAHHVRALGPPEAQPADPGAIAALRDALASAGERVPNRIPVSMAMTRLEEEFAAAERGGAPPELSAPRGGAPRAGGLRPVPGVPGPRAERPVAGECGRSRGVSAPRDPGQRILPRCGRAHPGGMGGALRATAAPGRARAGGCEIVREGEWECAG